MVSFVTCFIRLLFCWHLILLQVETEDGGVYYYHSVTRVSRWDRPNEEVAAALEARILQANSQVDEAVQVSEPLLVVFFVARCNFLLFLSFAFRNARRS